MRIWDVIADMQSLKTLNVELNVPGIWRESWRGWEDALLECLVEVVARKELSVSKSIKGLPYEEVSRNGEDWRVDCEYEYEEGGWGLWVPWPHIDRKEKSEGIDTKGLVERLGCQIVWG